MKKEIKIINLIENILKCFFKKVKKKPIVIIKPCSKKAEFFCYPTSNLYYYIFTFYFWKDHIYGKYYSISFKKIYKNIKHSETIIKRYTGKKNILAKLETFLKNFSDQKIVYINTNLRGYS